MHEHPVGASSSKEESIEILASNSVVNIVVGDRCQYNMHIEDQPGRTRLVMKPTRWMSSIEAMLKRLSSRCTRDHEHASLLNGRAKEAAIYPDKLCIELLNGHTRHDH